MIFKSQNFRERLLEGMISSLLIILTLTLDQKK